MIEQKKGKSAGFKPGHKLGNRFKPGESGNPAGRPPGSKNVSTVLRAMLEQIAPGELVDTKLIKAFCKGKTITNADAIAARLLKSALIDGELPAIREILDRAGGKPKQSLDIDLAVADWRTMAEEAGILESDVIAEAKLLLAESDID